MRANPTSRFLRGALAAVLACGLMMPTGALAATDEGSESTSPQQSLADTVDGAAPSQEVPNDGDDPSGTPGATDFDDALSDTGVQAGEPEQKPSVPDASTASGKDTDAQTPEHSSPAPSLSHEIFAAAHKAATQAVETTFAAAKASSDVTPRADAEGWTQTGTLKVKGGEYGKDYVYTAGTMQYRSANYTVKGAPVSDVLEILTDEPLTIRDVAPFDPGQVGDSGAYSTTSVTIREGVHADVTFDGVHIFHYTPVNILTNSYDTKTGAKATDGAQVRNRTSLHLTLADGSHNALWSSLYYTAPIHCGEGSDFTLDDSVRNVDENGNMVIPVGGVINEDVTLIGGKKLSKGDLHSVLDSDNPGFLRIQGQQDAASIGGNNCETGGRMTFNGGALTATYFGNSGCAAGIGAGSGGNGTDTLILFNSGNYDVAGGYHGAGVGAACYDGYSGSAALQPDVIASRSYDTPTAAGDITIHGGYIHATGGGHGNGFGAACWSGAAGYNAGHTITVTGGTLYPQGSVGDLGGYNGYVVITGGSVYAGAGKFIGVGGTAWGNDAYKEPGYNTDIANDPNKVKMMTINLKSEIIKRNQEAEPAITGSAFDETITEWTLTVGGKKYNYGAPKQFFDGQLFLWLPDSAFSQEVTVTLKYVDKNGKEQTIEPLFREPSGSLSGTTLKRYIFFELPDSFKNLKKYYDGSPLTGLTVDEGENKIVSEEDGKELTDPKKIKYKYQRYSSDQKTPLGEESASSATMPCDVGYMRLTVDSTQYSDDDKPVSPDHPNVLFKDNYWGHRAFAWCEIMPTNSSVVLDKALWDAGSADEKDASEQDSAHKQLTLQATISHGSHHPDGSAIIPDKCQAPRGYVQLYVDGKAVGGKVKLVFAGDKDERGNVIAAGDPRINATAEAVGAEGSRTKFNYAFVPAEKDFLLPDATTDNKHIVSLQYLPPVKNEENPENSDPEPANYLESINPLDNPEQAPKAEVAIEPVDPRPTVDIERDPEGDPSGPKPSLDTEPYDPKDPVDPDDPHEPGKHIGELGPTEKGYVGDIVTTWDVPSDDNPHPGRAIVNVKTPSTGKITITAADGELYDAEFLCDKDGNPIRNDDGTYSLQLDPKMLGEGNLVFKQAPNGAYTGTTWSYRVTVKPNPKIAPEPSLAKKAENLTHPNGPTQPGDRIRYTVTAGNDAAGSVWTQVMVEDPLPACMTLDEKTVRLTNAGAGVKDAALEKALTVTAGDVGRFAVAERDGRQVLTAPAGAVYGNDTATLAFECTVKEDIDFATATAADLALANIANAQGKKLNPTDPTGPDVDLDPDPDPEPGHGPTPVTPPATPPGPGTVAPRDPGADNLALAKTVENLTRPSEKVTKIGDKLRYTVELANKGAANSVLWNAVITDPLPTGIEPVAGTFTLQLDGGDPTPVNDAAYDKNTRTLAVACGNLWGGHGAKLTFECTVTAEAAGADNGNVALLFGKTPTEDPAHDPKDPGTDPGAPATPPKDDPKKTTPPAEPPTVLPNDPVEGDVVVSKTAENLTSKDKKTHVGDEIRYRIVLRNDGSGTAWMDAVIRDDVPRGLEPVSGSIEMTLSDGTAIDVSDDVYNDKTRRLSVSAGRLYGGKEVSLTFTALVTEDAVGVDVGNVAVALGKLPSKWDPEGTHPEPGQPFDPPSGWEAWERDSERIASEVAYPPGTDVEGGVLPKTDGKKGADRTTIAKKRLAQTGDTLLMAAIPLLACALLAATALLMARRCLRRQR